MNSDKREYLVAMMGEGWVRDREEIEAAQKEADDASQRQNAVTNVLDGLNAAVTKVLNTPTAAKEAPAPRFKVIMPANSKWGADLFKELERALNGDTPAKQARPPLTLATLAAHNRKMCIAKQQAPWQKLMGVDATPVAERDLLLELGVDAADVDMILTAAGDPEAQQLANDQLDALLTRVEQAEAGGQKRQDLAGEVFSLRDRLRAAGKAREKQSAAPWLAHMQA